MTNSTSHREEAIKAAQAEDLGDLLNHIAWTDVLRPRLQAASQQYQDLLVNSVLGAPLPPGMSREQIAGICNGIKYLTTLIEKVLRDGERAAKNLQFEGISINT